MRYIPIIIGDGGSNGIEQTPDGGTLFIGLEGWGGGREGTRD